MDQRWWVGMCQVALSGAGLAKAAGLGLPVTEVPMGQVQATTVGTPAVLSLYRRAPDQALASEAIAALAAHVTAAVAPSPRRQSAADVLALDPSTTPAQAQAVAGGMASARGFALEDVERSGQAHVELMRLMIGLRAPQGPPVREAAERASAAIDVLLARP